jgi:hypothetical protein
VSDGTESRRCRGFQDVCGCGRVEEGDDDGMRLVPFFFSSFSWELYAYYWPFRRRRPLVKATDR